MSVGWKEDAAEQGQRMAQKMLEQQGEINALRAERDAAVARAEKAEAEVARLTAKLGQLPLDIADTLLAQADHLHQRFGGDQPRVTGRIGGLQEAAHMARRFKTGEQS